MIRDWLEKKCYPDHPKVGTAEQWVEWEKIEKSKPFCNFIVNIVPGWFDKIKDKIDNIIMWLRYRLQPSHKYHLINTGLKPRYYEIEDRMLHGMFNLLKEFCENEQPYHDWCWQSIEEENNGNKPTKFKPGREAALESLKWRKEQIYKEEDLPFEKDKNLIGEPTEHSKNAEEVEKLYLWWVDTYPNRRDPYDVYEDPYFDKMIEENVSSMELLSKRPPEEEEKVKEIWKKRDTLESQYNLEDQMMLIRLIKIRHTLWT